VHFGVPEILWAIPKHVLLSPFIKQGATQNETAIFKYEGGDEMSICQQVSVPIVHPSGMDWKNLPDLEIRVISPQARARPSFWA